MGEKRGRKIALTWAQVDEIRDRYNAREPRLMHGGRPGVERMSMDALGRIYGVHGATIAKVLEKRHPYDDETRLNLAFDHSGDI